MHILSGAFAVRSVTPSSWFPFNVFKSGIPGNETDFRNGHPKASIGLQTVGCISMGSVRMLLHQGEM